MGTYSELQQKPANVVTVKDYHEDEKQSEIKLSSQLKLLQISAIHKIKKIKKGKYRGKTEKLEQVYLMKPQSE